MENKLKKTMILLSWIIFVMMCSVLNFNNFNSLISKIPDASNLFHIFSYGFMSMLVFNIFYDKYKNKISELYCMSLCICGFIGFANELLQNYLPYRSYTNEDIILNIIGAFIGCVSSHLGIIKKSHSNQITS